MVLAEDFKRLCEVNFNFEERSAAKSHRCQKSPLPTVAWKRGVWVSGLYGHLSMHRLSESTVAAS